MRLRWAFPMLILAGAITIAPAQTSAPFVLRISGPGTVAAAQPVQIRVLLQNTSEHAIGYVWPTELDDSVLSIQGPSGQELLQKGGMRGFSSGMGQLGPGEVQDGIFQVDHYYDLSQPGKYTLQMKRPIAEDRSDKEGFISSNVISVTVSPEPVKPSVPLELALAGPSTFVSGSDVSLKVLAKNISDQDIFLVTDPDGSVSDRNCSTDTVVARPNGTRLGGNLAHAGPRIIQTIAPGAVLEALLDKKAIGFGAGWTFPTTYRIQLNCSVPGYPNNDHIESNALTLDVTPAPLGGPTPFTLALSGPLTVAGGDTVRVDIEETDRSDFGGFGLLGQLDPLDPFIAQLGYSFSVRDPSGHELPLNAHTRIVPGSHSLKSTETGPCNFYEVLSDYYDFSQPGTYRVQVNRHLKSLGDVRVFSNVITISVTPPAAQHASSKPSSGEQSN